MLSHSVLKTLASSEKDKEWEQTKLTPSGAPKVWRPPSLSLCLHLWKWRGQVHSRTSLLHRYSWFCIQRDHGNQLGTLKGVHSCEDTLSDKQWIRWTFGTHGQFSLVETGTLRRRQWPPPALMTNNS